MSPSVSRPRQISKLCSPCLGYPECGSDSNEPLTRRRCVSPHSREGLLDDLDDLDMLQDPFDGGPSNSFEDLGGAGSEDDLCLTYMDIEKLGSKIDDGFDGIGGAMAATETRLRGHRHSSSMYDSSLESIEAKKAMASEKLAELWPSIPNEPRDEDEGVGGDG